MSAPRKLTLPRSLRLLLFPFPFAVALSFALLVVVDDLVRPDRSHIQDSGPAETAGTCAVALLTLALQAFWGAPTLFWLETQRSRFRAYAAVGVASAVALSVAFALIFQAPQFGETFGRMLPVVFLFFGGPLILGYLLAHSLIPRPAESAGPEARPKEEL